MYNCDVYSRQDERERVEEIILHKNVPVCPHFSLAREICNLLTQS